MKFTDEELATLREPIDKFLSDNGLSSNRLINLDETSLPKKVSHQKGSLTTEGENLEKFKPSCMKFIKISDSLWFRIRT